MYRQSMQIQYRNSTSNRAVKLVDTIIHEFSNVVDWFYILGLHYIFFVSTIIIQYHPQKQGKNKIETKDKIEPHTRKKEAKPQFKRCMH